MVQRDHQMSRVDSPERQINLDVWNELNDGLTIVDLVIMKVQYQIETF